MTTEADIRRIIQDELRHLHQSTAPTTPTAADGGVSGGSDGGGGDSGGDSYSSGGGSDGGGTTGDVGGDFGTPISLYIDPATGKTYGVFSGGLVLPVSAISQYAPANALRWTNDGTPTGTVEAAVWAYDPGPGPSWQAIAYAPSALTGASAGIAANDDVGNGASLSAQQNARNTTASVTAFAPGGRGVTLMDQAGTSHYLQVPPGVSPSKTQGLWGHFTAGSVTPGAGNSGGFIVTKTAVGQYAIAWTDHFTSAGYGFIPVAVGGYCDVLAGSQSAGSVTVELRSFADVLTDLPWNFLALGVAS